MNSLNNINEFTFVDCTVPDSASGYDYYYYVKDYQGNIRMVLDEENNIMESNGYYPYGMPMHMGDAQPYKYGGKELDRTNGLDLYDFGARWYAPDLPRFLSLDPLAEKYPSISPYAYCAGNPVRYIEPTGKALTISGSLSAEALRQLQANVGNKITLKMDESGKVSYEVNTTRKIRGSAKRMMEQIDDQSINVNLRTMGGSKDSDGRLLVGGAFKGNTVTTNPDGSVTVEAYQDVNPNVLGAADEHTNSPDRMMMHEMTEAYEGAAISKAMGVSSPA